jgi:hypothetical protein
MFDVSLAKTCTESCIIITRLKRNISLAAFDFDPSACRAAIAVAASS